ncbi:MAG: hypothetical protein ABR915_11180 [Thermoguttaceae bacterium]|jgi:hypothetical protein
MSDLSNIKSSLLNSAGGPGEVRVEGMGQSREHNLRDQLAVFNALASAAAGPRAGIRRVGIRVSSPTGLRFRVPEDMGR